MSTVRNKDKSTLSSVSDEIWSLYRVSKIKNFDKKKWFSNFFEKVLESGLIPPLFKNKFLVISPFLITYTYKLFLDVFLYFYWQQYEFMDKKISHNFDIQKVHTVNFTKYIFHWASTPYISRTYMHLFSAKNISVIFIVLLILAKCQIQYWF